MASRQEKARHLNAYLVFLDESGFLLIPTVRRTWAPRGQTPVLYHRYRHDKVSAITVSPVRQHCGLYAHFHVKRPGTESDRLRRMSPRGPSGAAQVPRDRFGRSGCRICLPCSAPLPPTPFVPCDAAKVSECRRARDPESRRPPDPVDHDEHRVGNVIFRNRDTAAATGSHDSSRLVAQRGQRHRGRVSILLPQAEPSRDERGLLAGTLVREVLPASSQSHGSVRQYPLPRLHPKMIASGNAR